MPYTYTLFGAVPLPTYNIEQDHSTGAVDSTLVTTPNAAYDYLGSSRRLTKRQVIPVKGVYFDELNYLVDGLGNYVVDSVGDYIVIGDSGDTLRNYLDNLKAKLGRRDQLWRYDYADNLSRWKYARLLKVDHPTSSADRAILAFITATFETEQATWHSQSSTTSSGSLVNGLNNISVDVLGSEYVNDPIITITAATTITSVHFVLAANNVDFTWTGTLSVGNSLVIDCGALTIKNNGSDAYSGFTLASGHLANGWVQMTPAATDAVALTIVGTGTYSVVWYDQWT